MRVFVATAIACLPSGVLGPVLAPPCSLHRPLGSALALQGDPVLRAWAPHIDLLFMVWLPFCCAL